MNKTDIYNNTVSYAAEHGELEQYRASFKANMACRNVITDALAKHYKDNRLDTKSALKELTESFTLERIALVMAVTVREQEWDGRISHTNKEWAKSVPFIKDTDDWGNDRNAAFRVSGIHTGLIDLFAHTVRKELENTKTDIIKKPSLIAKIQKPLPEKDNALQKSKGRETEI